MKEICRLFLVLLILCCTPILLAQDNQDNIDNLFVSVGKRLSGYPSELIYLQTSKGIYETGEDLWFKAYQFDAQSFGLSDRSKTLYLQMVDSEDSVVWREKYPIENGIVDGHVYVDEKLPEGDYSLEGYTRYSFCTDTIGILSGRKIRVVKNIAQNDQRMEKGKDCDWRFDLFPEGGNLVSGISSRLAFKATDGKGLPVDVEGTLYVDGNPTTIFKSSHDGMGVFSLTPFLEKKYRIELKNGKTYSLPEIYPQGMSFQLLKKDKERMEFVISQTEGLPEQDVYLLGQMRGVVCCVAKGRLKNSLKIKIPAMEFPYQGIAEFTLFDGTMQPIAERLVYVHPEKRLNISIEPDKDSYVLREKATLKIKVTDDDGKPIQANLGISVFDKIYMNPADPANILTHCYLTSQIRGIIHDPAYYFNEENKDRMEAMDLLLLTQGWRRYVWSADRLPYHGEIFLPDEISGTQTIGSKKKSKETQSTEQLIQVSGAEGNSVFVWADSAGCFTIDTDIMKDVRGGYVYLKPMLSKEFKPKLEITDYFSLIDSLRKNRPSYYPIMDLSETVGRQVLDMPVVSNDSTILLDEVVVTRKARKPFRDKFMGRLDSLAQLNIGGAWVCECQKEPPLLNDYLPGYTHHIYHTASYEGKRLPPVNGRRYELIKYVQRDNGVFVEDIKEIVYSGPIYSEEELLRMNNLWKTKGYYAVREFYHPDEIDMQLSTPDARNTLLWQPSVNTDKKGEATISFFCSDINTGFTGIVEGTNGLGLLGTGKCEFRVVRNID
ncbi:hypothetical protein [Parabacteroides sp.]|uniref:hypothetical protein n=1 Tax=Parabacteroides sp. TaxID=1869337 RepID=UPI0030802127